MGKPDRVAAWRRSCGSEDAGLASWAGIVARSRLVRESRIGGPQIGRSQADWLCEEDHCNQRRDYHDASMSYAISVDGGDFHKTTDTGTARNQNRSTETARHKRPNSYRPIGGPSKPPIHPLASYYYRRTEKIHFPYIKIPTSAIMIHVEIYQSAALVQSPSPVDPRLQGGVVFVQDFFLFSEMTCSFFS
jgi:hypothetical protein